MTRGFVDLHCHYLPGIDDGVRTAEQGFALLEGLRRIGFAHVVATPHIRTAMFENRPSQLLESMSHFEAHTERSSNRPELGLGAEHFLDDVFFERLGRGEVQPYPGGRAILVELPPEVWPLRLEQRFFDIKVRRLHPVLAHPERYTPLFRRTDPLDPLLDVGALPLLDLMSLVGKYGRSPQRAAERMLEEDVYYAACSDCHRPEDVPHVEAAIRRLEELVGDDIADELLAGHPRRILDGTAEY